VLLHVKDAILELDCKPKLPAVRKSHRQTYHGTFRKRIKTLFNYSEFALNYGCLRPIRTSATLILMGRVTSKSLRVDGKLNRQIYRINGEPLKWRLIISHKLGNVMIKLPNCVMAIVETQAGKTEDFYDKNPRKCIYRLRYCYNNVDALVASLATRTFIFRVVISLRSSDTCIFQCLKSHIFGNY